MQKSIREFFSREQTVYGGIPDELGSGRRRDGGVLVKGMVHRPLLHVWRDDDCRDSNPQTVKCELGIRGGEAIRMADHGRTDMVEDTPVLVPNHKQYRRVPNLLITGNGVVN